MAKLCFLTILSVQFEYEKKTLKTWKSKMAAASNVI